MKRLTSILTMTAGLFAATLTNQIYAKETIAIGDLSWDASHAIGHILKAVIETKLGADAKVVPGKKGDMFDGMDKGDGSFDVIADLWMPNNAERWAKFVAPGSAETVLVNDQPYLGSDGIYIPGYMQDKYKIKHIKQLADPKIAKFFNLDNSGKRFFWPGAPDWNSTNVELVRAKSYGYNKNFKPTIIPDPKMREEVAKLYAEQKPFVIFFWEPEGLFKKYDLRKLKQSPFNGYAMENKKDDPQYNPDGCYNMHHPTESPDWLSLSKVTCANPSTTIYVAYSKSLVKRAPNVARFLKQVNFDTNTLNQWILEVSNKEDPEKVAKKWIAENPKIVNGWLRGITK